MKYSWKTGIILGSAISLVILIPNIASAQQSIETEDLEQIADNLEEQSQNEQPWSGLPGEEIDILNSSGNVFDDLLNDVFVPIEDFFDDVYETINPVIDDAKLIFAEVNSGLDSVVNTVLGEIGLANPQTEANSVGWTERSPHYDPQTPTDIARRSESADAQKSQVFSQLAQVIFGEKGQQVINRQNVILGQTQQDAAAAHAGTTQTYTDSVNLANQNIQLAARVAQTEYRAASSGVTQDVAKAIAAQNEDIANISAGISQQLAFLGEGQLYSNIQMEGLNTQLTIANQRSQNVETFLAAQNSQLAEIDSNQELAMKREIERDNQVRTRDRQGITRIFIPGLFSSEAVEATAESNTSASLTEPPVVNNFFSNLSENLNQ